MLFQTQSIVDFGFQVVKKKSCATNRILWWVVSIANSKAEPLASWMRQVPTWMIGCRDILEWKQTGRKGHWEKENRGGNRLADALFANGLFANGLFVTVLSSWPQLWDSNWNCKILTGQKQKMNLVWINAGSTYSEFLWVWQLGAWRHGSHSLWHHVCAHWTRRGILPMCRIKLAAKY